MADNALELLRELVAAIETAEVSEDEEQIELDAIDAELEKARAYLASQNERSEPAVAAKVCPREPTADMVEVPFVGILEDQSLVGQMKRRAAMANNWRAMYDAAPAAAERAQPDDGLVAELRNPYLQVEDYVHVASLLGRAADRIEALQAQVQSLTREVERDDARDAKRYRWVVANRLLDVNRAFMTPGRPFEVSGGVSMRVPIPLEASLPSVTLDAAIDAAIAEQEGK